MKLCKTILKYHSWYLCQISLQVMLLLILTLITSYMKCFGITQPFWETRDRRLGKETSTIHDLNHTGKKTNRGSSCLDSEYLVPHVKEVGLGHSSQIQFRWISHLPTLDKRSHTHSTFDPVCFKNEGD